MSKDKILEAVEEGIDSMMEDQKRNIFNLVTDVIERRGPPTINNNFDVEGLTDAVWKLTKVMALHLNLVKNQEKPEPPNGGRRCGVCRRTHPRYGCHRLHS